MSTLFDATGRRVVVGEKTSSRDGRNARRRTGRREEARLVGFKVVAMAMRPARPSSETYPSVCCTASPSVSYSSLSGLEALLDEPGDRTPIFSLSKSAMDVVTATGPPHKRDPAWTGMALRRSSSAGVPVEPNPLCSSPENPQNASERRMSGVRRWSRCSAGAGSGSSTPDTVVWGGGGSRPCSLTRDAASAATVTSSPFISPLMTPTLPSVDLCSSSAPVTSGAPPQEDHPASPRHLDAAPSSKRFFRVTSAEDDAFLNNRMLYFQYPSPMTSSVGSEEGASLTPASSLSQTAPRGSADEERDQDVGVRLQLPWQPGQGGRSALVSSASDSLLREGCRCCRGGVKKERGTMTPWREAVDVAVQTLSPAGSWWDLRRNTSHTGSPSLLGSPPGSRLNLKASIGSNSNLVSPSSSMFPGSNGEDEAGGKEGDDQDAASASGHDPERKRSCLKVHGEEKGEPGGRRGSMKQVQWDEDGMTWDVHGASVDPQELSVAIQKHLELHNSPDPAKRPSAKKKAPKPPLPTPSPAEATPPGGEGKEDAGGGREEAGGEDESFPNSPSRGSVIVRKRSVMRSLRPGWCGGSRKED
ncbi:G protein-regulated inducer of neurite outgrowth 1 [Entelurus aequoreus]|uniref:G protein-regulated inducer of neurite outgrowth 1 n=1 Tax=Entelurus aequoreus TaxID=161455 RepID=UPI002B1D6FCD|nr:G protein-regulated inducer of neurite outgrowth 1 [Entelurus aequoreus]